MSRDTNSDAPKGASEYSPRDLRARARNLLVVDMRRFVYARKSVHQSKYTDLKFLEELLLEASLKEWLEMGPDTSFLWAELPNAAGRAKESLGRWVQDAESDLQEYLKSFDPTTLVPRKVLS